MLPVIIHNNSICIMISGSLNLGTNFILLDLVAKPKTLVPYENIPNNFYVFGRHNCQQHDPY
jgi:hypothetical protein